MVIPEAKQTDVFLWIRYDGGNLALHVQLKTPIQSLRQSVWQIFRSKAVGDMFCGMRIPDAAEDLVIGLPLDEEWLSFEVVEDVDERGKLITLKDLGDASKKGPKGLAVKPRGYEEDEGLREDMFKVVIPVHEDEASQSQTNGV